jgi:nitrite reductase (cytochrome c-552)
VKLGVQLPIPMPDISSKELAQKYIGLDIDALKKDKIKLLETVVKEWDKEALKRQGTLIDYKLNK